MASGLAVFGSSGRTGRQVAEAALRRGLSVHGLVRTEASRSVRQGVSEIVGAFDSESDIDRVLEGCTAVCIVFGPRPPYTDIFCAAATEAILNGMRRNGIDRVVCQTGAMMGPFSRNRSLMFDFMAGVYQRRHPAPHADRVAQEELVRGSGLRWTVVKPPRLTHGSRSALDVGPDVKVGLFSAVSRLDLGEWIVDEVREARYAGNTVFVRGRAGSLTFPRNRSLWRCASRRNGTWRPARVS